MCHSLTPSVKLLLPQSTRDPLKNQRFFFFFFHIRPIQNDQKNSRRSSKIKPPQMMKASRPRAVVNHLLTTKKALWPVSPLPIHNFEMDGFGFCFCLTTPSGFPRFADSCLAYRSFAFRCWGVCAWLHGMSHNLTRHDRGRSHYHDLSMWLG